LKNDKLNKKGNGPNPMTLIPETKDTTPQTLQNGYPAGNPAVNLNTLR